MGGLITGIPTQQPARVGIQAVTLYPWNGTTGPYNATTAESLYGLASLDNSMASKSALVKGGEAIWTLEAFETDREIKVKIMARKASLRSLGIILGGTPLYNPANSNGLEEQYWTSALADRAPYFRLLGQSTNGDGTLFITYPKLRADGNVTWNFERDTVTDLEFEAQVVFDYTYVNLIGQVGAPYDFFWSQGGESSPHS